MDGQAIMLPLRKDSNGDPMELVAYHKHRDFTGTTWFEWKNTGRTDGQGRRVFKYDGVKDSSHT